MKFGLHGDVILKKVNGVPTTSNYLKPTSNGYVLAEGEQTGHAHRIVDTKDCELYDNLGVLYLRVKEPVEITHEEHHTVTLPVGDWEIGIQKEYDHIQEMERKVID